MISLKPNSGEHTSLQGSYVDPAPPNWANDMKPGDQRTENLANIVFLKKKAGEDLDNIEKVAEGLSRTTKPHRGAKTHRGWVASVGFGRSKVGTPPRGLHGETPPRVLGGFCPPSSLEWNDDVNEEQGGSESLPTIAGDGSVQTSDVKDDSIVTNTEENEWDRLLRVRWEKYQSEEEAALGRGKRLRKAVSYKESFAPIPSDALSESGNEEDEPEPEYTPAGRALKAKLYVNMF
ncbi:hypothetical protein Taro_017457 [Colocasia esculenta]|uniref:DUF1087 domain-containing protein n=1 Tax=Colocasia esculenta TaxID=4460 RepID=A0A843UN56_COLES|nr:hypothetical protein [Colocasia esculenta]